MLPTPLPPGRADEILPGTAAIRAAIYEHPEFVPRVRTFTDAVHAAGAVAVVQLTHLQSLLLPSAVQIALDSDTIPRALDEDEIEAILDTYPAAADRFAAAGRRRRRGATPRTRRCRSASCPRTPTAARRLGRRRLGADPLRREAVRRVRDRTGSALAVGVRLCADEHREGGYDLADMQRLAAADHDVGAGRLSQRRCRLDVGRAELRAADAVWPVAAFADAVAAIRGPWTCPSSMPGARWTRRPPNGCSPTGRPTSSA